MSGGRIEYGSPGTEVSLEGLEHHGSAVIEGATYTVSSSTTVESLTVRIAGVRYIKRAKASVNLAGVLRADEQRLEVERLEVALNELTGEASGRSNGRMGMSTWTSSLSRANGNRSARWCRRSLTLTRGISRAFGRPEHTPFARRSRGG